MEPVSISAFQSFINALCTNRLLIGSCVIFSNLGGRFLMTEMKNNQDFFTHPIVKKIIIFAILFTATRDIKVSLIVLLAYILLFTPPYLYANKLLQRFHGKNKEEGIDFSKVVKYTSS